MQLDSFHELLLLEKLTQNRPLYQELLVLGESFVGDYKLFHVYFNCSSLLEYIPSLVKCTPSSKTNLNFELNSFQSYL